MQGMELSEEDYAPGRKEAWIPRSGKYFLGGIVIGLVMIILSTVMVGLGETQGQRLIGALGILFFTAAAVSGMWRGKQKNEAGVILNEAGFVEVRGQNKWTYRWDEVVSFQVVKVSKLTQVVGYTLRDESHLSGLEKMLKMRYGVDGVLMRALSLNGERLEQVMNEWRRAYGYGPGQQAG